MIKAFTIRPGPNEQGIDLSAVLDCMVGYRFSYGDSATELAKLKDVIAMAPDVDYIPKDTPANKARNEKVKETLPQMFPQGYFNEPNTRKKAYAGLTGLYAADVDYLESFQAAADAVATMLAHRACAMAGQTLSGKGAWGLFVFGVPLDLPAGDWDAGTAVLKAVRIQIMADTGLDMEAGSSTSPNHGRSLIRKNTFKTTPIFPIWTRIVHVEPPKPKFSSGKDSGVSADIRQRQFEEKYVVKVADRIRMSQSGSRDNDVNSAFYSIAKTLEKEGLRMTENIARELVSAAQSIGLPDRTIEEKARRLLKWP